MNKQEVLQTLNEISEDVGRVTFLDYISEWIQETSEDKDDIMFLNPSDLEDDL